jgi:ribosomal protein L23
MKAINKKQVIIKPLISEKTLTLYHNLKVCTFIVERESTKKDIAFTFESMFGIKPEKVKVVVGRDAVSTRNRKTYQKKTKRLIRKKAYVSIGENKLDIFENIK